MQHGKNAGFLAFEIHVEDVMMLAMTDKDVWIGRGERARDDAPLRDGPESRLQQAGIAPLLPCTPLAIVSGTILAEEASGDRAIG